MKQLPSTGKSGLNTSLIIFILILCSIMVAYFVSNDKQTGGGSGAGSGKCGYGHEIVSANPTQWQVTPNQDIIGEFQYLVWNRYGGKTSLNVMIVGVVNQKGKLVGHTETIFGPQIPGECRGGAKGGSATFALLAPNRPGTYSVITISGPAYNHGDLRDKYETGREKVPTQIIGTVNVVN